MEVSQISSSDNGLTIRTTLFLTAYHAKRKKKLHKIYNQMKKEKTPLNKRLFRYFLQGILLLAPAGITIYAAYLFFTYVDTFLSSFLTPLIKFRIPGLGILIFVVVVTLLGFFGQSFIFKPLRLLGDSLMRKVPLIKVLYTAISDLFTAFVGSEKRFKQPVLVMVNKISELEKIGFITTEDLTDIHIKDKVAVYFPHSYNFSGELFIVPKDQIKLLDIPAAEAMKFIVSGGITKV
jgi:uncharacterized membrane protein